MENSSLTIISLDREDGRVMVLSKSLDKPFIRVEGKWSVGTFSAVDLRDNFHPVEEGTKDFDTFFQEAKTFSKSIAIK